MKKKVTIWDFFVIILLSIVALSALFIPMVKKEDAIFINITVDDETTIYDINENSEIKINSNGYVLTIIIENKSVYVSESSCNDSICVNTGSIDSVGESIVCAPANVIIHISGTGGDVDHIIG